MKTNCCCTVHKPNGTKCCLSLGTPLSAEAFSSASLRSLAVLDMYWGACLARNQPRPCQLFASSTCCTQLQFIIETTIGSLFLASAQMLHTHTHILVRPRCCSHILACWYSQTPSKTSDKLEPFSEYDISCWCCYQSTAIMRKNGG